MRAALRDLVDGELTAGWQRYGMEMSGWVVLGWALHTSGLRDVCGVTAALSVWLLLLEDLF